MSRQPDVGGDIATGQEPMLIEGHLPAARSSGREWQAGRRSS
jgi:hypothetical protein